MIHIKDPSSIFLVKIILQTTLTKPGFDRESARRETSHFFTIERDFCCRISDILLQGIAFVEVLRAGYKNWYAEFLINNLPVPVCDVEVALAASFVISFVLANLARTKEITNDALPVIMSASDWASFMVSCTVHQVKYQR